MAKEKRKVGRPKLSDEDARRVITTFRLSIEAVKELDKLKNMFSKRTGFAVNRSRVLEMLIMNESKKIIKEIDSFRKSDDEKTE